MGEILGSVSEIAEAHPATPPEEQGKSSAAQLIGNSDRVLSPLEFLALEIVLHTSTNLPLIPPLFH